MANRDAEREDRGPATFAGNLEEPTMSDITLTPIGYVRNSRHGLGDFGWGPVESTIELRPEFAAGLAGLESFSHALVIFHLHEDPGEPAAIQRRPRGRADMPLLGVFAQRGRVRPNPVGVTAVAIVRVEPDRVVVRGLDAIDGTPVIDLKPYFPDFDRVDGARVPEWVERLMRGYFED
jgi:tRNA (adenine37-N6)-methyltransferase